MLSFFDNKRSPLSLSRSNLQLSMANNDLIIARKNIETIIEKGEKKEKVKLKEKELDMLKQHMDKVDMKNSLNIIDILQW